MTTKSLTLPLTAEDALSLKVGDMVLLNGLIVTGRDKVHRFLRDVRPSVGELPVDLKGGVIYHCGPIIKKVDDAYSLVAAGPTTSMRMEMYEADVIRAYGLRGVMGKGGMGPETLQALKECGCVYLNTMSGAAAYLADRIKSVSGGWKKEEFGEPEAMWVLEVEDFPAVVTMDSMGGSLHQEVEAASLSKLKSVFGLS